LADEVSWLPIAETDKRVIDKLLPSSDATGSRVLIAINPGAKFPVNRWPKERFLELARKLVSQCHSYIVLIGGEDARDVCSFIAGNMPEGCLNLCGETTILQTAEVLSRCRMLVSCDSGPLHLAAAVGIPVVGIYSCRDYPNCWYPWQDRQVIIRHDLDCQVCLKEECGTMECVKAIGVEEVLAGCRKILQSPA